MMIPVVPETCPDCDGSQNEYVVIRGDVVVPRAVTTVTEYVLPEAK